MSYTVEETSYRGALGRRHLAAITALTRGTHGPFTAADAAKVLSLPMIRANRLLAYLASRGWLTRVAFGLYAVPPLEADDPGRWREDPWVLANKRYSPCYIGGWSACEHWDLTEQIFRDVIVFTTRRLNTIRIELQGTMFRVKHIPPRKLFGTRPVWRGTVAVPVSDPTRTIVDVLAIPPLGGGIRHVSEVLRSYFESKHRDENRLLEYSQKLGNGTVFKRLGFLVETLRIPDTTKLAEACRSRRTSGLTMLDPSVKSRGRIVKRWNLLVNVALENVEQVGSDNQG